MSRRVGPLASLSNSSAPNGFHLEISTAYVNIIKNDERPELAGIINTISRLLSGQMKSLAAVKWFQNGETNGLLHELLDDVRGEGMK